MSISHSPEGFYLVIKADAKKVPALTSIAVRKLSFKIFGDIARMTPVDTGRAQGSWTIFVNEPASPRDAGPVGGSGGAAILNAAELAKLGAIKPFSFVNINNSLPYIQRLEEGHSTQAQWFVRSALNTAKAQARSLFL